MRLRVYNSRHLSVTFLLLELLPSSTRTKYKHYTTGQKKKGKKPGSGSSTTSSSRSDTPTKGIETADKTIADAAKKLKDISSPGTNEPFLIL